MPECEYCAEYCAMAGVKTKAEYAIYVKDANWFAIAGKDVAYFCGECLRQYLSTFDADNATIIKLKEEEK